MSVESNPGLNWFCFTVLFDWSRKLAPPSQPIRCKLKPIAPWSLAFSRATGRLHAFTSSCHWLPLIISFTLIGRCDYFGFGFRHSIEKRSINANTNQREDLWEMLNRLIPASLAAWKMLPSTSILTALVHSSSRANCGL